MQTKDRVPSDRWGWHIRSLPDIEVDPTDIPKKVNSKNINRASSTLDREYIYNDGYASGDNKDPTKSTTVSLLWGFEYGCFQPRAARAVAAMPYNLLKSKPFTTEDYSGEGLGLAMGILGRNKGVKPWQIVFNMTTAKARKHLNMETSPITKTR